MATYENVPVNTQTIYILCILLMFYNKLPLQHLTLLHLQFCDTTNYTGVTIFTSYTKAMYKSKFSEYLLNQTTLHVCAFFGVFKKIWIQYLLYNYEEWVKLTITWIQFEGRSKQGKGLLFISDYILIETIQHVVCDSYWQRHVLWAWGIRFGAGVSFAPSVARSQTSYKISKSI